MNEMLWILFGAMCVALIGWMLYMMTFRTDDWLRLVKDEQERKAKRDEQIGKAARGAAKGAFILAKLLGKRK